MFSDRVVIVGAGQAGARAAEALRKAGFAGPISILGEEPYEPYERPVLSKQALASDGDALAGRVFPRDWYTKHDIDLRTSERVGRIDAFAQRVIPEGGQALEYGTLLLCTGSSPRKLPAHSAVQYLRTVQDCERLRHLLSTGRPLFVVGGGFIGLEVAATAKARGVDVTVCEQQAALLSRVLPEEISERIAALHRAHGVMLRLGHEVAPSEVDTSSRSIVIAGIGVVPNIKLAAGAAAEVSNGIVVDEYCRTSLPNVYAAGDVTNHYDPLLDRRLRLESWHNAQNQAIAAARNIAGIPTVYADVPWFWSDQFEVNMQMAGVWEPGMGIVWRGDRLAFGLVDGRLGLAVGFNAGGDIRVAQRLIAAKATIPAARLADKAVNLKDYLKRPPA